MKKAVCRLGMKMRESAEAMAFRCWLKGRQLRNSEEFQEDEAGVGTIELVLILVVLIAVVLVFKEKINVLVDTLFTTIDENATKIAN